MINLRKQLDFENDLIDLLLIDRYSTNIENLAKKLESISEFTLTDNSINLKGIWELRWSSSKAPFLNYSPILDNLQIIDPNKLNGMNLIKPIGIKSILGTGILFKLKPFGDIRIGVRFTHAGLIGPSIGLEKIKALVKIRKEQTGWLDITYLSNKVRICRGDKGTLFILIKREDEILFNKFKKFINIFN